MTNSSHLATFLEATSTTAEVIQCDQPTPTVEAAAAVLGVDEQQVIKSLLFVNKAGDATLAIAAGTSRVSRKKLAAFTGLSGLKLAKPGVVRDITGYEVGAVAPIAHTTSVPVVMDERVMRLDVIYGGSGETDTMLKIAPAEIQRLTNAQVADIVEDES